MSTAVTNSETRHRLIIRGNATMTVARNTVADVTLVAGGGAGGLSVTQSAITLSGGGGGGGEAKKHTLLSLLGGDKLEAVVGKGGTAESPDGEDSILTVIRNNNQIYTVRVKGGKGALFEKGGEGGSEFSHSSYKGDNGTDGEASSSQQSPVGGVGGSAAFSRPSKGGTAESPIGIPGEDGAGGGGSAPGTNQVASGGNGFIMLVY